MNKIKQLLDYYFNVICLGLIIFLLTGVLVLIYRSFNTKEIKNSEKIVAIQEELNDDENKTTIKVDIKGAVKKPGVYEMDSNSNVLDVINKAGGLTKNATTSNINLSRLLEDQMVIKIFTKSELKKKQPEEIKISECVCEKEKIIINECNDTSASIIKTEGENINIDMPIKSEENNDNNSKKDESNADENKLISINKASKEELMTLNSIGEAKANAIIEYRNSNGNFKTIEDIKNVSGIGDALFAKIKDYITV